MVGNRNSEKRTLSKSHADRIYTPQHRVQNSGRWRTRWCTSVRYLKGREGFVGEGRMGRIVGVASGLGVQEL